MDKNTNCRCRNTDTDGCNLGEETGALLAEIQRAVVSIKMLPAQERIRVYHWAIAEMKLEAVYAAFDQACEAGYYNTVIAETDEEYRKGSVLTEIY